MILLHLHQYGSAVSVMLRYLSTVCMAVIPSCPPIAYRYPSIATTHTPLRGLLKGAASVLQLSVSGLYLTWSKSGGVGGWVEARELHLCVFWGQPIYINRRVIELITSGVLGCEIVPGCRTWMCWRCAGSKHMPCECQMTWNVWKPIILHTGVWFLRRSDF